MTDLNRILICALAISTLFGTFLVGVCSTIVFIIVLGVTVPLAWHYVRFSRPQMIAHFMLLIISSGTTVVITELVSRPVLQGYLYYRPDEMLIQRWPRLPLIARYKANAHISRESFGDLAAMSGDVSLREKRDITFITDSFGFRNELANDDVVYNTLILGDSFAVGTGTTQEQTWVSLLGRRYNLRVYDLAVIGSPWQSFINLFVEIRRINLHGGTTIILEVFTGNDLDEDYASINITDLPWSDSIDAMKTSLSTYRNRSAVRQLMMRLFSSEGASDLVLVKCLPTGGKIAFFKPYVERRTRSKLDIWEHKNYPCFMQTLGAIKGLADQYSATFKVILVPSKEEVYSWVIDGTNPWSTGRSPSGFAVALGEFCQEGGIEFLDLKPFLLAAAEDQYENYQQLLWWSDDTHWNSKGHALVADIVYKNLLALQR